MFGYPTGLGALLVRVEAVPLLKKVGLGAVGQLGIGLRLGSADQSICGGVEAPPAGWHEAHAPMPRLTSLLPPCPTTLFHATSAPGA